MKIKIIDTGRKHISFKYVASNAASRMDKNSFLQDYKNGVFDIVNPGKLNKDDI